MFPTNRGICFSLKANPQCMEKIGFWHSSGTAIPGLNRTAALGAGGPEFKSRRPDQNISRVFFGLLRAPFTPPPICGILADRSSQFANRLVSESSPHDEFSKTRGGRSAIQKLLNGGKLSAGNLASVGKIEGTLRISRLIDLRKCKSVKSRASSARASS